MSRTVIVLVALLVVAPMAATPAASADEVALTVTVVDQSGNAVQGAELTVRWDGGSTTAQTRSNGKAFVDVPAGADVEIDVEHPDYVRNHPYEVEDASEREVTVPMHQRGSATIAVTDSSGAVSDARVILRKDGQIVEDGRTGADGTYSSAVIEQGQYQVTVLKRSYYRERVSLTVDGDVEREVEIRRGSVALEVRVTDPHFEPPRAVEGLTIAIESVGEITTQPDGTASAGVPVNAELQLTVTGDDYEEETRTIDIGESDTSINVSISRTLELTLSAANERVLTGERTVVTVRNEYEEPIEGATVLLDDEAVGETDANGQLAVPVSDPGQHTLTAEHEQLRSNDVSVTGVDPDGETATATATATADGTDASGPGFTFVAAVVALLAVAVLASRE